MVEFYKNNKGVLYNGDCLNIMKNLNHVDAIIADPPYGTTACKWDSVIDLAKMWRCIDNITNTNTPILLMGSQPFTTKLISSNMDWFRYCWVWNKKKGGNIMNLKHQPYKIHEDICVFSKKAHNYFPIMEPQKKRYGKTYSKGEANGIKNYGDIRVYNTKNPKSILEISNANQKGKINSTQKPVELYEYLVKTYTKEGDTVLDFSSGSGTLAIACENLNRSWIMIEIRVDQCKSSSERIKSS